MFESHDFSKNQVKNLSIINIIYMIPWNNKILYSSVRIPWWLQFMYVLSIYLCIFPPKGDNLDSIYWN